MEYDLFKADFRQPKKKKGEKKSSSRPAIHPDLRVRTTNGQRVDVDSGNLLATSSEVKTYSTRVGTGTWTSSATVSWTPVPPSVLLSTYARALRRASPTSMAAPSSHQQQTAPDP